MKKISLIVIASLSVSLLNAQDVYNEFFSYLSNISRIEISGAFDVVLVKSDSCGIIANQEFVGVETNGQTLQIMPVHEFGKHSKKSPKNNPNKITIYVNSLESLKLTQASSIRSENRLTGEKLNLEVSGASSVSLLVRYDEINTDVSGASKVKLEGSCKQHNMAVSGASGVNAESMMVQETNLEMSGSASAYVTSIAINGEMSGPTMLTIDSKICKSLNVEHGRMSHIVKQGEKSVRYARVVYPSSTTENDSSDTNLETEIQAEIDELSAELEAELAELDAELAQLGAEMEDERLALEAERRELEAEFQAERKELEAELRAERREMEAEMREEMDDDTSNNFTILDVKALTYDQKPHHKKRKKKFETTYGFFDIGLNSYGQSAFQHDLPSGYENMELSINKSFTINLNFLECGIQLGNSAFGVGTGVGLGWNIYRFLEPSMIADKNNGQFVVNPYAGAENRNFKKSKLQSSWVRVPLYVQYGNEDGFHALAGVVGSVRLGASSKQVYKLDGKKDKHKESDDFYLSGLRADAEVRIGYKEVSVFATYSLTSMFVKNHGPELTTYSFGVSLFP